MVEGASPDTNLSQTGLDTESQPDVIDVAGGGAELFQIYKHAQRTHTDLNSQRTGSHSERPSTVLDDERNPLATRILTPILQAVTKTGKLIYATAITFHLLGLFVLALSFTKSEKQARTGNTERSSSEEASGASTLHRIAKKLKGILHPTSSWVPLVAITAILSFTLNRLNRIQVDRGSAYDGTGAFQKICPEEGRRTQEAALVRLFAATVTAVGINGHLGSLSGSTSCRRELLRALEVIIVPLAAAYHLSGAIFYELSFAAFSLRAWPDDVGIRYRLARMCRYQIPLASREGGAYIGTINIKHLKMIDLTRDLKYYGRMFVLTVLLAQCVQTSILLTRRIISHTTASVDLALMFMVISSTTALLQSFTISGINTKWFLKDDVQPCLEQSCRLSECVDFKKGQGMPLGTCLDYKLPFGFRLTPQVPRAILHMSTAGMLQFKILLDRCRRPQRIILDVVAVYMYWRLSLLFLTYCWLLYRMFFDEKESIYAHRRVSNDDTSSPSLPTTPPLPPASTAECNPQPAAENSTLTIGGLLIHALGTVVGILFASFGSFSVLFQLGLSLGPFIIMYLEISAETSAWGSVDSGKPCPQLWKDGLEDMLWLF